MAAAATNATSLARCTSKIGSLPTRSASGLYCDNAANAASIPLSSLASNKRSFNPSANAAARSEEHTSELQSPYEIVCRHILEKKKQHDDSSTDHQQNRQSVNRVPNMTKR